MIIQPDLSTLIIFSWAIYIVFWILYAKRTKITKYRTNGIIGGWIPRILVLVILIVLYCVPIFSIKILPEFESSGIIGFLLFLIGIVFAVWARMVLGTNWSSNLEVKEQHSLVISGPYSIVRHPIYSGVILALIGTFIFYGKLNVLIFLIVIAIGMSLRAITEDRLMEKQFPTQYQEYKKRVKSLIPFLL